MDEQALPVPSASCVLWPVRRFPTENRWGQATLPQALIFRRALNPDVPTVNLTALLMRVIEDITQRSPTFAHIRPAELLVTFTPARNRRQYGLLARVTPMRFQHGVSTRRRGGVVYQIQRFLVDGREMLYLVTFCLPRFLEQSFEQKLVTIFHELYHISPNFDGDLRRHAGRYEIHTHSKKAYDAEMLKLVREYLADHPQLDKLAFLNRKSTELRRAPLNLTGVVVPRPKMVPIGRVANGAT
jgi:Putative phage metallopeptidase